MTQTNPLSTRPSHHALALAGVVGPPLFVTVFTIAGELRTGYSATAAAISDLGVGPQAWIQNTNFVVFGALLLLFAIGFRQRMATVIDPGGATASGLLIATTGTGLIGSAIFTAAPATEGLHLLLGFLLTFGSAITATVYVGRRLRDVPGWRRFARYSRLTALGAVLLVALSFVALNPSSPLEPLQLGGVIERALVVEVFVWHTAAGSQLLRRPPEPSRTAHRTDRQEVR